MVVLLPFFVPIMHAIGVADRSGLNTSFNKLRTELICPAAKIGTDLD